MAYSCDYSIGLLCESVNRAYALKEGHHFVSDVLPCEDMLATISPKKHITWYKVYLLLREMKAILEGSRGEDFEEDDQYLFWIDGDAVIINHTMSINTIIEMGEHREFIIAEDMHVGNPFNAGVFMMKVCSWSVQFLQDIWQSNKYDDVYFYEQSAMIKAVRLRRQGLTQVKPFHSYVPGGPSGVKIFPQMAVFPISIFSSNHIISLEDSLSILASSSNGTLLPVEDEVDRLFVFHAAGMRLKLEAIKAVILKYHLPCEYLGQSLWKEMEFRLFRNSLGHPHPPGTVFAESHCPTEEK